MKTKMLRLQYLLIAIQLPITGSILAQERASNSSVDRQAELVSLIESTQSNPDVRLLRRIAEYGPEGRPAIPLLIRLVDDSRFEQEAIKTLAAIRSEPVPSLIELCTEARAEGDHAGVQKACRLLGAIGEPAQFAIDLILDIARDDSNRSSQRHAILALARVDSPGETNIQRLLEFLKKADDPELAIEVGEVLTHEKGIQSQIFAEFLDELGIQEDPCLEERLISVLIAIDSSRTIACQRLVDLLDDERSCKNGGYFGPTRLSSVADRHLFWLGRWGESAFPMIADQLATSFQSDQSLPTSSQLDLFIHHVESAQSIRTVLEQIYERECPNEIPEAIWGLWPNVPADELRENRAIRELFESKVIAAELLSRLDPGADQYIEFLHESMAEEIEALLNPSVSKASLNKTLVVLPSLARIGEFIIDDSHLFRMRHVYDAIPRSQRGFGGPPDYEPAWLWATMDFSYFAEQHQGFVYCDDYDLIKLGVSPGNYALAISAASDLQSSIEAEVSRLFRICSHSRLVFEEDLMAEYHLDVIRQLPPEAMEKVLERIRWIVSDYNEADPDFFVESYYEIEELLALLKRLGDDGAPLLPSLITSLESPTISIRVNSIKAIAALQVSPERSVAALANCLDDPNPSVQSETILAMCRFPDFLVRPHLEIIRSCESSDWHTVVWAARRCLELFDPIDLE